MMETVEMSIQSDSGCPLAAYPPRAHRCASARQISSHERTYVDLAAYVNSTHSSQLVRICRSCCSKLGDG